ncbi:MAG: hypothetical protein R2706_00485 [Acidimicrobiales bacterium]
MARAYPKWSEVRDYDNPEGWCFRVGINFGARCVASRDDPQQRSIGPTTSYQTQNSGMHSKRSTCDLRDVVVCRLVLDMSSKATATHLKLSRGR